jgi:1-deoxy-D-xylulose-5-phosphate synthase
MAPKDEQELRSMLHTALQLDGPAVIRYPRGTGFGVPLAQPVRLEIGRAEVLEQGRDAVVIAIGTMATLARQAARKLRTEGIALQVVNARFCRPLDVELYLDIFKKYKKLVTIEENVLAGGFGSAVDELAQEAGANCRILRLGLPNAFVPHGTRAELLERYGLSLDGITGQLRDFLNK